jgi:isoquinoline 1-oxidoreductase beta subunit
MAMFKTRENPFNLDRRDFLRSGAAGLVVSFTLGAASRDARAASGQMLGAYIQIADDNTVTVYIGPSEMGQGIMTGLAMLAAEELKVDWSTVRAVEAPAAAAYANPLFHAQLTGGSTSMRGWFTPMRQAAAIAREMLITAGAAALGQQRSACVANNGAVWCGAASVPYAQIVGAAALLTPPASAPLDTAYSVIGQRLPRVDIPAKVDGSAVFGIDVRVPGMLYAVTVHSPTLGGTVASVPSTPRGAVAVVNLGSAVGVVANSTWEARAIAQGLRINWNIPSSSASITTSSINAAAQQLMTAPNPQLIESSGFPDSALANAVAGIDATYSLPYMAHACMEVLNCTASVTPTSCEIWAPTQGQATCVATAATLLGIAPSQVTVHTTFLGGGLGRKIEQDYIAEAILIAKAVGVPVKLTWTREQDFQNDKFRPCALIRVRAGVDQFGGPVSMIYRNVAPSINVAHGSANPEDTGAVAGATGLPYDIPARRIEFTPNTQGVPIGYWRSVGESYNTFAVESAIDELALLTKADPVAYRQRLLAKAPRELAVLNAVAALAAKTPLGRGAARGVAFLSGFGSVVAQIAEVTASGTGPLRITRVFCAIDCGTAVNPDSIEAQMQGGIVHGLSATLWGGVTFNAGVPSVSNFNRYRMARMGDMPQISVAIVNSGAAVGGVGEAAVPCVAPAIANAYARLTGVRVRTLPFYPGATMGD